MPGQSMSKSACNLVGSMLICVEIIRAVALSRGGNNKPGHGGTMPIEDKMNKMAGRRFDGKKFVLCEVRLF